MKDPTLGYAKTFLRQLEDCLGTRARPRRAHRHQRRRAQPRRPRGRRCASSPTSSVSQATIAHVEGDDLHRPGRRARPGQPADRQRLPRRVRHRRVPERRRRRRRDRPGHRRLAGRRPGRRALRLGPRRPRRARRRHGRRARHRVRHPGDRRQLRVLHRDRTTSAAGRASRSPRSTPTARRVITKHPGTGGAVTVETVTAQLLYEIAGARYLGPDVTTRLDTIALSQDGPTGCAISGVARRGAAAARSRCR